MSRKKDFVPGMPASRMPSRNVMAKRAATEIDVSDIRIVPLAKYHTMPNGSAVKMSHPAPEKPVSGLSGKVEQHGIYINSPEIVVPTPEEAAANKKRALFIQAMGTVKTTVRRK
jgi:hypothetical protein